MSSRYTAKDVTEAFNELTRTARELGVDTSTWDLVRGDARLGSPYLVFYGEGHTRRTLANFGGKAREDRPRYATGARQALTP
jgi:hypothetical protein